MIKASRGNIDKLKKLLKSGALVADASRELIDSCWETRSNKAEKLLEALDNYETDIFITNLEKQDGTLEKYDGTKD